MSIHSRFTRRPTSDRQCLMLLLFAAMLAIAGGASAQTTMSIDQFGAGNAFRPGGSTAVRIRIQSDLDEPVPGIVQWETVNGDGDTVVNSRRWVVIDGILICTTKNLFRIAYAIVV